MPRISRPLGRNKIVSASTLSEAPNLEWKRVYTQDTNSTAITKQHIKIWAVYAEGGAKGWGREGKMLLTQATQHSIIKSIIASAVPGPSGGLMGTS